MLEVKLKLIRIRFPLDKDIFTAKELFWHSTPNLYSPDRGCHQCNMQRNTWLDCFISNLIPKVQQSYNWTLENSEQYNAFYGLFLMTLYNWFPLPLTLWKVVDDVWPLSSLYLVVNIHVNIPRSLDQIPAEIFVLILLSSG